MANRRQMADELKSLYGPMVNQTQLREFLNGMSKNYILDFMQGIDCYRVGKKKLFFANDIARKLETVKEEATV